MLLTLVALAAVLILMEEAGTRLVRHLWRTLRWFVLPAAALTVVNQVPMGLFGYPAIMDTVVGVLLAIAAACLVAVHGTFRDGHWRTQVPRTTVQRAHVPARMGRVVRATAAGASTAATVRAPVRSRP